MSCPVTIGDLRRDRRLLWVYCRECGRERDLDPSTLSLPGEHPVPEVGKRMRCTACGSRKVYMAPDASRPPGAPDQPGEPANDDRNRSSPGR
jgi:DNA-directed RNA polymerase subunit RPC12/RpoP